MISIYSASYEDNWPSFFDRFDNQIKIRIVKKIKNILEFPKKRHLEKGARFFVDEVGQNRIVYRVFEGSKEVRFYFVGNHKEYEKWYKQFF